MERRSITEQGQVMAAPSTDQRAPRASGAQERALLDFAASHSSVIYYIADLKGIRPVRFVSSNVEAITGHKPAAFLGEARYGLSQIHPDDVPGYQQGLDMLQKQGAYSHEYRFRCRDGEYRWFRDEQRITENDGGSSHEFIGCMIDITERVSAEQETERLGRLLRDAVETMPNSLAIYDAEKELTLCNTAFASLFGETPEAMVGSAAVDNTRSVLRQLKQFDKMRVRDPEASLARALARAEEAEHEPIEIQLESGKWLQFTSHALADGGRVDIGTDITRLKHAEVSLRDSEALVRSVLTACPVPIRMWNPETGQVIYESPASRTLLGRDATRPTPNDGKAVYVDLADRERYLARMRAAGAVDNMEMQLRHADGKAFWAAVSARFVQYRGEDFIVSVIQDLTDQKEREDELRRARETLDDAIEALSEGLVLYDADDRLVLCNSQYKSFHQGSEDLLVPGATWTEITRQRAERGLFPRAIGRIDDWIEEERSQRGLASNEEFPFSGDRWFAYSHRSTRQGGLVSTWRDISARKAMEQVLRESEELVRQVLEACPTALTMNRVDDGVIIYESPAARELLKYEESQVGKSVIARWANVDERKSYLARLRRDGAVDGLEIRYRRANGEEFWCALSSRLIDYRGERVIVSNLFDLTDRRAAEAELASQREILHQREKLSALGELLAGVSHELNNPLSVLVGQALMLKEQAPDDKVAARAAKIGEAADRCARIVKSFLAMAREEPSEIAPVDLTTVIESALEVTAYSVRSSGIEVSLRMAKALPPVMADADQMRQVFTNLIINAKDALQSVEGPRQLRITASHRKQSDLVVIKVKDNGPGIPAEIRTRVFEPLYTTKEIGTGTGVGLALCHRIIEAHGGSIVAEGPQGEGAVFAIRLPCAKHAEFPAASNKRSVREGTKGRVLVVEDESDVRETISDVLQHDGHSVDVAASGDLALQKVKRRRYDVILSDIRMPGMDGPGFYRALSDTKPEQISGLAFITGDTLSPQAREFLNASEQPYLEKPLTPRDIRELVDLLMRRKAS
jgi:PAS domain S-box-containing protein